MAVIISLIKRNDAQVWEKPNSKNFCINTGIREKCSLANAYMDAKKINKSIGAIFFVIVIGII